MAKDYDYPTYDAGGRVEKYAEGGEVDIRDVVKKVKKKVHDENVVKFGEKELKKHKMASKHDAGPYKVPREGHTANKLLKTTYVDRETGETKKIPKKYQSQPKEFFGRRDSLYNPSALRREADKHSLRKDKKQVDKLYKKHKAAVASAKKRAEKSKADVDKTVKKILESKSKKSKK